MFRKGKIRNRGISEDLDYDKNWLHTSIKTRELTFTGDTKRHNSNGGFVTETKGGDMHTVPLTL